MPRILLVLFFGLTLSGCVTTSWFSRSDDVDSQGDSGAYPDGVPKSDSLTADETSLYDNKHWQMSGRLSITSEKGVWSGALRWRQKDKSFVLSLNAPLGQGALQLKGDDIGVELTTADGKSLMADDVDTLLEKEIGWALPVSGLRYWIFGIPNLKGDVSIRRDQKARISQMRQSGWLINIKQYQLVSEIQLPKKLVIRNPEFNIRLVIDGWLIEPVSNQMAQIGQIQPIEISMTN